MITPQQFRIETGILRWTWLMPRQTGKLRIQVLDWQNPSRVIQTQHITHEDYRSYYMRYGFAPDVPYGFPVTIRVNEQVDGDPPVAFEHTILADRKHPIQWEILKSDPAMWELRVHYPDFSLVAPETYPEKMFHFLIQADGEAPEQGAKFHLPRPIGSPVQRFWFDPTGGYSLSLQMDKTLPLGKTDRLSVGDVFILTRK